MNTSDHEPEPEPDLLDLLNSVDTRTSRSHDEVVLAAARAARTAQRAHSSTARVARRWLFPAALAASFVAGSMFRVGWDAIHPANVPRSSANLMLPLDATRGHAIRAIPVEQAMPAEWYHYIQELVAAGETREAEIHLRRFNELHPDYVHQP